MASLLSREQRNLGEMIFSEIRRYMLSGTRTTHMPYLQLVSLFLRANKIWYLEPNEPVERLLPVGRNQIGKLGIELPLRHSLTTTLKKNRGQDAEAFKMDDTKSSVPAPSTARSFLRSSIQTLLREVLHGFHVDIANTNAELVTHVNHKMAQMFEAVNQHHQAVSAQQEIQTSMMTEMVSLLRSLYEKVDSFIPGPSTPLRPTHVPSAPLTSDPSSSNVIFSRTNPTFSTQVHITLDEPTLPQPASSPFISDPVPTGSPFHTEPPFQPSSPQSHLLIALSS